ncbi:MAG: iron-sulfur cluster assembly scaffold protein [Calditrichaceae bacterium]|nr:iron-sulfur cluster assembly scaffold protein [Calditrichaceae bacterium]
MKDQIRAQLLSEMGFSQKAIEILEQNLNMGIMDDPTITAQYEGSCGDILMLALKINNNCIEDAMYEYIGCAGLQSCASAMTEMIKQKSIDDLSNFKADDIVNYLGGIPESKYECAEIARNTLLTALNNFRKMNLTEKENSKFENV